MSLKIAVTGVFFFLNQWYIIKTASHRDREDRQDNTELSLKALNYISLAYNNRNRGLKILNMDCLPFTGCGHTVSSISLIFAL